jgi:hypothetical protein
VTKTQREVIEEIIRKAERGPALSFIGTQVTAEKAQEDARRWSETWIAEPLRLILDNVDGKRRAYELKDWTR